MLNVDISKYSKMMSFAKLVIFWPFISTWTALLCKSEFFTSMADVESLLQVEGFMTNAISEYVNLEIERLKKLKRISHEYRVKNSLFLNNDNSNIGNPLNSFLLIKHFTSEWSHVEVLMKNNVAGEFLNNITNHLPDSEDVQGAASALMRLQDTYNLSVGDIADGKIFQNESNSTSLSLENCFELGRFAYNQTDFYHTILWMQETLSRLLNRNVKDSTLGESEILDYLAFALYKQGNVKRALKMSERLKILNPQHPKVDDNIKYYRETLKSEVGKNDKGNDDALPFLINERKFDKNVTETKLFESLCRGEIQTKDKSQSNLYCYYKSNRPFLRLAPLKVEIVHLKPKISIFRQFVSDKEIDLIKHMAQPRLQKAEIRVLNKRIAMAKYRTAKSAWLKPQDDPILGAISRRQEDMTDLSMDTAEMIQVANYGIGGHYGPHHDFASKDDTNAFKHLNAGNRIATILIYNDAVFWYNLLSNGEGDENTRHGSCPVLSGIKWVSNRWIHEYGQEFRRPCGLDENEYE